MMAETAARISARSVNKWDLVLKDSNTLAQFEKQVRSELRPIDFAEVSLSLSGHAVGCRVPFASALCVRNSRRGLESRTPLCRSYSRPPKQSRGWPTFSTLL